MDSEIRSIQLKCLEILDIVDSICRKNNISYSLCGGSVVGAHLYGACLPWDDDVDLMMTRENYNRFIEVVRNELPEGFSVHNYQLSDVYWSLFTKIVNDNTTIVQQDGTVSGVFLDITVYDKIPQNWRRQQDILLWKISQVVSIGKLKGHSPKTLLRNAALSLFFKDERKYLKYFQKKVEKNGKATQYSYSELFGAFCNTKPYSPEIFENYAEIEFEGKRYMIVRDYVKYLETRYERTDFREPKEKQVAPHYMLVDLTLPYEDYIKRTQSQGD
ncbi:MAG: phosphorylcholine transferase LicD [Acutalibacteraceae bacterium]